MYIYFSGINLIAHYFDHIDEVLLRVVACAEDHGFNHRSGQAKRLCNCFPVKHTTLNN